jgi:hypothetical protein
MMHPLTRRVKRLARRIAAAAVLIAATVPAQAFTVWTHSYNNSRTGANTSETVLNTSNVNVNTFGRLFNLPVDADMYAETLYVPGLTVNGATHNVLYVATMNNSMYAYDADNGTLLWHTNYGTPIPYGSLVCMCGDIQGTIGIESTPVIDTSTNTMYFVVQNDNSGVFSETLHAVDITTGAEKMGGPEPVTATYDGVTLNPQLENQRTALTLANGTVYFEWSSHCDCPGTYHGIIVGYQASNITNQQYVWAATVANGDQGGIWMAGQGRRQQLVRDNRQVARRAHAWATGLVHSLQRSVNGRRRHRLGRRSADAGHKRPRRRRQGWALVADQYRQHGQVQRERQQRAARVSGRFRRVAEHTCLLGIAKRRADLRLGHGRRLPDLGVQWDNIQQHSHVNFLVHGRRCANHAFGQRQRLRKWNLVG